MARSAAAQRYADTHTHEWSGDPIIVFGRTRDIRCGGVRVGWAREKLLESQGFVKQVTRQDVGDGSCTTTAKGQDRLKPLLFVIAGWRKLEVEKCVWRGDILRYYYSYPYEC